MASGTIRETAVTAAVGTRPMNAAIRMVFWYDQVRSALEIDAKPSMSVYNFLDSLQYQKARKYLRSHRQKGSVWVRVPDPLEVHSFCGSYVKPGPLVGSTTSHRQGLRRFPCS
jgi:hypothetical protein